MWRHILRGTDVVSTLTTAGDVWLLIQSPVDDDNDDHEDEDCSDRQQGAETY